MMPNVEHLKELRQLLKEKMRQQVSNDFFQRRCCSCNLHDSCPLVINDNDLKHEYHWFNCFVRKFFRLMGIKWGTLSIIEPTFTGKIYHYNYSQQVCKEKEFYDYFEKPQNFSISKYLFEEKIEEIVKKFPLASIWKIQCSPCQIRVSELGSTDDPMEFKPPKPNYSTYLATMKTLSGINDGKGFDLYFITTGIEILRRGYSLNGIYLVRKMDEQYDDAYAVQMSLLFVFADLFRKRYHELVNRLNMELLNHALRSTVAAIMARNMSHNIGSHMLNYLSNENYFENNYKCSHKFLFDK